MKRIHFYNYLIMKHIYRDPLGIGLRYPRYRTEIASV